MTTAAILVADTGASSQASQAPASSGPSPDIGAAAVNTGSVVALADDGGNYASGHERATRAAFAERIAALKGLDYRGEYDAAQSYARPLYFVPGDTLADTGKAQSLGITGLHDLFGGVVPHPFVLTKAITHPLVHADAARPAGWSGDFAAHVAGAVLTGFSAFSREDARAAGCALLRLGAVRIKPVRATGGRGQRVVRDADALFRCLDEMDDAELARHGVVLEENLVDPVTFSIGQVTVGGLVVSYHGTQRMTKDQRGETVYGGSDLWLVRGGFDALLATRPPFDVRLAIDQARLYHDAVVECFSGFFTSRLNYDVARGRGPLGQWRSGVLEQSWRVGGATGAELAALELFRDEPERGAARVSCFETYGDAALPPQAAIYHRGVDPQVGLLTKYTLIDPPC
jgi:hypothetical protein